MPYRYSAFVDPSGNPISALTNADGTLQTQEHTGGGPAPGHVRVNVDSNGAFPLTASPQTVHLLTVPAGKTHYVTDILITSDHATPVLCKIQANGVNIWSGYVSSTAPLNLPNLNSQPQCGAGLVLDFIAGANNTHNLTYDIYGFQK